MELNSSELSRKILSDITVYAKYAKYIPNLKRRETWEDIVMRNVQMHIKKYPELEKEIWEAYSYVLNKQVVPSMRSMQFAGKPIDISPNRIFNCFRGNTKFITSSGTKSFDDFNDGDDQLYKITFSRGKTKKSKSK